MRCQLCGNEYKAISKTHLDRVHNTTMKEYQALFGKDSLISPDKKHLYGITLENMIRKYGEEVGTKKWEQYVEKQRIKNTYQFKKQKYGWSKQQFKKYNLSRAVTKENLIIRYGQQIGLKKWEQYVEKQRYAGCKKEYFIQKYGQIEGIKKYKILNRSKDSSSLSHYISKYGEQLGREKYVERIKSTQQKISNIVCSNISQQLFTILDELYQNNSFFYARKNQQIPLRVRIEEEVKIYFVDFCDVEHKKIIQFNGDYWHANPIFYNKDDLISRNRGLNTASIIWEQDLKRDVYIRSLGYDILYIWEHEFKTNKTEAIQKCRIFLNLEK